MKLWISVGACVLCGVVTLSAVGQQRSPRDDDSQAGLRLRYDDEDDRLSLDVRGVGQQLHEWWRSWWEEEERSRRSVSEGAELGARAFMRRHDTDGDGYLLRREMPAGARDEFGRVDRNDDDYLSRSEVRQYGEELYGTHRGGSERYGSERDATARRESSYDRDSSRTASSQTQASQTQARQTQPRQTQTRRTPPSNQEGQSWSEWWSSWFSDDQFLDGQFSDGQDDRSREQRGYDGARQFVRQHDEDGDGYISRSEMPQRMRDEFTGVDRNRDGYLSTSEVRQGGLAQGESSGSRQSRSASLSRRDASEYSSSQRSQERPQARSRQQTRTAPVEVAYVWVIDANQGTVQLEDLQKAYEVLREIDADQDGRLTHSELREQHQEAVSQWCEQCFTQLDSDGDGRLSREEAQSSVFAARFDSLDGNSDGELTEDEVRRSMQEQFEARTESSDDETRR